MPTILVEARGLGWAVFSGVSPMSLNRVLLVTRSLALNVCLIIVCPIVVALGIGLQNPESILNLCFLTI